MHISSDTRILFIASTLALTLSLPVVSDLLFKPRQVHEAPFVAFGVFCFVFVSGSVPA